MNAVKTLVLGTIIILTAGCETDGDNTDYLTDIFDKDKYYKSEIFSNAYTEFYGKWNLYSISGGFWGGGYEPDFDFLEIKKYGIYGFIRNDSILEYGKIIVEEQTDFTLLIYFEADEHSELFMGDTEKYVHIRGKDSLNLNSPCCDRFNYHYVRAE